VVVRLMKMLILSVGGTLVCSCGTRVDADTLISHVREEHGDAVA